jgi:4-hydroxy-2-oxoglutarate aldolase
VALNLDGVFPAIPTPFTSDDAIDVAAARANAARWISTGLRGLLVLGSNGEAPLVDADEGARLIAAVREETPRDRVLIAGVNAQSTRQAIAAARAHAAAGADVALVITPFYFKSQMSRDALVRFFTEVADASPIPLLVYNVPQATGVTIPLLALERIAPHPNIIGVKDSSGDVGYTTEAIDRVPADFDVVVGVAPNLFAALSVGARGAIVAVASVFPELCVELHGHVRAGRRDQARAIQRAITPLARAVTTEYGPAGLKVAAAANGYVGGLARAPLMPLGATPTNEIRMLVEQLRAWAETRAASTPDALQGVSR